MRKTSPVATQPKPAVSAVEMGARQREISVSEFFTKNRHLLGFDNPRKALLTCVKEAVDNALDACEEAGILPDVIVKVEAVANGERPPITSRSRSIPRRTSRRFWRRSRSPGSPSVEPR